MTIKDWPSQERPREKLLKLGAKALSDAELLAIFLRTGTKGKTAIDLARELLSKFGGLRKILNADYKQLRKATGIGSAKYCQLKACCELHRRYLQETIERQDILSCPKDTHTFLQAQLRDQRHEIFSCLFLDSQNRVICFDQLFIGTINYAHIYPREIIERALEYSATSIIFVHNHPSGNAKPSRADIEMTRNLQKIFKGLELRLLDHLIVGDGETISLAELGLI